MKQVRLFYKNDLERFLERVLGCDGLHSIIKSSDLVVEKSYSISRQEIRDDSKESQRV